MSSSDMLGAGANPNDEDFEQAMAWAAKLALNSLSQADKRAIRDWLIQAPRRHDLLEEALEAWSAPSTVLAAALQFEAQPKRSGWSLANLWHPVGFAVAAAAVAAVTFLFYQGGVGVTPDLEPIEYAAPSNVSRTVQLVDGSTFVLERGSQADFSASDTARRARLFAGEALFEVAPDASAPFTVEAGDARIKVIGTRFNVNLWEHGLSVTVLEGAVQFQERRSGAVQNLTSGHGISWLSGRAPKRFAFAPEDYADWTSGWVSAENMSLGEVLGKLNRYADDTISVSSASLNAESVSGRFRLSQTDATLETLAVLYGFEIERSPGRIDLVRAVEDSGP